MMGSLLTTFGLCFLAVAIPSAWGHIEGVVVSDPPDDDRNCSASGYRVSFPGSCRSRNYIYTSACNLAETFDADNSSEASYCTITADLPAPDVEKTRSERCPLCGADCGCAWWNDTSKFIFGIGASTETCDACDAYNLTVSGATGLDVGLVAFATAVTAWFVA